VSRKQIKELLHPAPPEKMKEHDIDSANNNSAIQKEEYISHKKMQGEKGE